MADPQTDLYAMSTREAYSYQRTLIMPFWCTMCSTRQEAATSHTYGSRRHGPSNRMASIRRTRILRPCRCTRSTSKEGNKKGGTSFNGQHIQVRKTWHSLRFPSSRIFRALRIANVSALSMAGTQAHGKMRRSGAYHIGGHVVLTWDVISTKNVAAKDGFTGRAI